MEMILLVKCGDEWMNSCLLDSNVIFEQVTLTASNAELYPSPLPRSKVQDTLDMGSWARDQTQRD
jgi:hypothetical protein